MANTVIEFQEIRIDVRDPQLTHAYVLVANLSRDGFPIGGWYYKAFPASVSAFDILKRWQDGAEDPLRWARKAPE